MPADLHVHFRLPAAYAKRLKVLADLHGLSPSLAARLVLVEALENTLRQDVMEQFEALQEELAALKRGQGAQSEELRAFRAEFQAALIRASTR